MKKTKNDKMSSHMLNNCRDFGLSVGWLAEKRGKFIDVVLLKGKSYQVYNRID